MALTETELSDQWAKAVRIIEKIRAFTDDDIVGVGNVIEDLEAVLEGDLTPQALASAAGSIRAGLSDLISPGVAQQMLIPLVREYMSLLPAATNPSGGAAYQNIGLQMKALYEHFANNSKKVKSRQIAFDAAGNDAPATPTGTKSNSKAGSIVGGGDLIRCTENVDGYEIENCHVETKTFRCVQDRNAGVDEHAEVFEHIGSPESRDSCQRATTLWGGSGVNSRTLIRSKHAGSGAGGSMLRNSSFTDNDTTATQQFDGWTLEPGGTEPTITTTTAQIYRGDPTDGGVPGAAKFSADGTIKQVITDWNVQTLDTSVPYFCRVMVNADVLSATGASCTVEFKLGSSTTGAINISAMTDWYELRIGSTTQSDQWFRNFNEPGDMDVEIIVSNLTGGSILVDDVILSPYTRIDGTFYAITQQETTSALAVPWAVDDNLEITDTGGAPTTGRVQYWLWRAGLGFLPHQDAAVTSGNGIVDPSA